MMRAPNTPAPNAKAAQIPTRVCMTPQKGQN